MASDDLIRWVKTTGPIPLAYYMRQCLTSPDTGYYMTARSGRDPFGPRGDFITSPEVSQIFGELIGIWFVAEWMSQGSSRQDVQLIEVGPGRGTLMDDILRTIRHYPAFATVVKSVRLVEASPALRAVQKERLCPDAPLHETAEGFTSVSKYLNFPVTWTEEIRHVPTAPATSFIVAHEFFDALPIHVFQSISSPSPWTNGKSSSAAPAPLTKSSWRELLVSPTSSTSNAKDAQPDGSEFQLRLAPTSTAHSLLLPELSERYRALKARVGSTIEISPEAQAYAEEFARRIGGGGHQAEDGQTAAGPGAGAALIIDYGPSSTIPINSLRGVRAHRRVSPFSSPGQVDLSVDVDFQALAEAALRASPSVEVHGPVEQASFLRALGVGERAEQLANRLPAADGAGRKAVETGWRRLVDRGVGGMGRIYKAMAIVPEVGGRRRPVGFGGDLAGTPPS
ncbi:MAG: hypothetical protein M1826_006762 [Phylliscum demangeonii]|nr:MAG: hypothetical protein M1826_006762 [Phylliscum demangeonii]